MKPRDPHADHGFPRITEERFLRAAHRYVMSAYPNPDRKSCPGRGRLEVIARRKIRLTDDDIYHITSCSPCFAEYHGIRKAWKRRRAMVVAAIASAASIFLVLTGAVVSKRYAIFPPGASKHSVQAPNQVARNTVIDLRPYQTMRGTNRDILPDVGPLVLERTDLNVSILLPIGSEEGQYIISLLDSRGVPRLKTSAGGVIESDVTTVRARFDLGLISPGEYTLTFQRAAASAVTSYPLEVR